MKLIAGAALLFSIGCAATNSNRETIKPKSVEMIGEFQARESARFAHLAEDADGIVAAEVQVCVAPDGQVKSTEIVKSSGSQRFDDAALRDVANARYRGFEAPAEVKVCNNLRVVLDEG